MDFKIEMDVHIEDEDAHLMFSAPNTIQNALRNTKIKIDRIFRSRRRKASRARMIKKTVQYEDFDGNTQTEDLYFNIYKHEAVEWQAGGVVNLLQGLIKPTASHDDIIKTFKKIIGMAYGVRDGLNFRKSEQITADFLCSPAYDALFTDLVTSERRCLDRVRYRNDDAEGRSERRRPRDFGGNEPRYSGRADAHLGTREDRRYQRPSSGD